MQHKIIYNWIKYNNKLYKVRVVDGVRIAPESMQEAFFDALGNYISQEAEEVDNAIAYFVPEKEFFTLTNRALMEYIRKHVDESADELFISSAAQMNSLLCAAGVRN